MQNTFFLILVLSIMSHHNSSTNELDSVLTNGIQYFNTFYSSNLTEVDSPLIKECSKSNTLTKILEVPYLVQPDGKTCQSTCLKMLAKYKGVSGQDQSISSIYNTINKSEDRPIKKGPNNNWTNVEWWWNENSDGLTSEDAMIHTSTTNYAKAIEKIVASIDNDFPVLLSVKHKNIKGDAGHFVLVVGYKDYLPNATNPDFLLICHDPYGEFFPELKSTLHRHKRHDAIMSLPGGDVKLPGEYNAISIESIRRIDNNNFNIFHER